MALSHMTERRKSRKHLLSSQTHPRPCSLQPRGLSQVQGILLKHSELRFLLSPAMRGMEGGQSAG